MVGANQTPVGLELLRTVATTVGAIHIDSQIQFDPN